MVRIRINEKTRALSFRLANGKVLKRGEIIDVPSEAIQDDEIARQVIEHISDELGWFGKRKILRIFFPRPGIGDVHWVFLKLKALLKRHGARQIDALVASEANRPKTRSQEFLEANPLVRFVQYVPSGARQLPAPGYMTGTGTDPWDYALDFTEMFDKGQDLATEFLPGLKPDWHYLQGYDIFKQLIYEGDRKDAVCFSMLDGHHPGWGKHWNQANWAHLANLVGEFTRPMAVGLKCDWQWADGVQRAGGCINNAAGKTDRFFELIMLLRQCRGVIGTCSGLTMIAAAAGIPTIIVWPEKFGPQCWRNWIHPDADNYFPVSYEATPEEVLELAREAFGLDKSKVESRKSKVDSLEQASTKEKRCYECGGEGVLELAGPNDAINSGPLIPCPKCNGTGKATKPEKEAVREAAVDDKTLACNEEQMSQAMRLGQLAQITVDPGVTEEQLQELDELIEERGKTEARVLERLRRVFPDLDIESLPGLTPEAYGEAVRWLKKCKKKARK